MTAHCDFIWLASQAAATSRSLLDRAASLRGWQTVSINSETAILSSIASGMMALTGIVFSMVLVIALIERISQLYISNVLNAVGDHGREMVAAIYVSGEHMVAAKDGSDLFDTQSAAQKIFYHGPPRVIVALDTPHLVRYAHKAGVLLQLEYAVGDLVADGLPIACIYGPNTQLDARTVLKGIKLGRERTALQDPKYPIRLLVDVAIRALSPAVNDPTTAVQALNQIEDLLRRLGRCRLDVGHIADPSGALRLLYPTPTWEDFLDLALLEIMYYGSSSVQVMRRLGALLDDLELTVTPAHKDDVTKYQQRLHRQIEQSFRRTDVREEAQEVDRQGLGLTRREDAGDLT